SISVPNDSVAAVAGHSGVGIAIVDFSDKSRPRVVYQNNDKDGEEVYTTTRGGNDYAFLAASGGPSGGGVFAYDMTRARQSNPCLESVPGARCPGVSLGRIGADNGHYVSGVDNFLVTASGFDGFRIWNVANPAS